MLEQQKLFWLSGCICSLFSPLTLVKKRQNRFSGPSAETHQPSVSFGDLASDENARLRSYSAEDNQKSSSGAEVSGGDEGLGVNWRKSPQSTNHRKMLNSPLEGFVTKEAGKKVSWMCFSISHLYHAFF